MNERKTSLSLTLLAVAGCAGGSSVGDSQSSEAALECRVDDQTDLESLGACIVGMSEDEAQQQLAALQSQLHPDDPACATLRDGGATDLGSVSAEEAATMADDYDIVACEGGLEVTTSPEGVPVARISVRYAIVPKSGAAAAGISRPVGAAYFGDTGCMYTCGGSPGPCWVNGCNANIGGCSAFTCSGPGCGGACWQSY
jgi:hypothetical protein